ncbi:hypothetical protein H5P28_11775 [Ruficoccus amylovorans]|uniref:Uncharacterized protein n=1 Tax=Ruficoccus amylovorans TaxID=1804625 RepID=A0A842HH36_9BACT|nr:hypothetical protein [Ruficoccus amylovorans]MBC2594936.1 hypothetical protein [Ruficoccus amylovorans]
MNASPIPLKYIPGQGWRPMAPYDLDATLDYGKEWAEFSKWAEGLKATDGVAPAIGEDQQP